MRTREISKEEFKGLAATVLPDLTHICKAMTDKFGEDRGAMASIYIGADGYIHFDVSDSKGTWELVENLGKNRNPRIGYEYSEDLTFEAVE